MNKELVFPNSYKNVSKMKRIIKKLNKKYNASSIKRNFYKNILKYFVFLALYTCFLLLLFINPASRTRMFKFILSLSPDMREYSEDLEESIVYLPVALKFCSGYNSLYKNFVVKYGINSFFENLIESVPPKERIPGEFSVIEESVKNLEKNISRKINEAGGIKEISRKINEAGGIKEISKKIIEAEGIKGDFVDLEMISRFIPNIKEEITKINNGSPDNIIRRTQEFILSLNG